jgi:ComF family protein
MGGQTARLIKGGIAQIIKRVEDFLIPPLCVICDGDLGGDRWFCAGCLGALAANQSTRDACPHCSQNRRKRECACEFAWDFPFEKVVSFYDYDDTLSSIARHIKYKGKSQLAYHMGFICAPLMPDGLWDDADAVIPVPLHKARMRKRGYNQAEFFTRGQLKGSERKNSPPLTGIRPPLLRTDLLTRVKNTGTQTQLDREGRLENLIGAFAINPKKVGEVKGKRVTLVDDIFTTGATTEACTEELLKAGCASVRVLSMGRD